MVTKQDFANKCLEYVGTVYHHQQSTKWGCDCIGLVISALIDLGFDYRDLDAPARPSKYIPGLLRRQLTKACGEPFKRKPDIGDIILFSILGKERHCGVMLDDDRIVHADQSLGEVTIAPYVGLWERSTSCVFEPPILKNS